MKRYTKEQIDKRDKKLLSQIKKYIERIDSGELSMSNGLDWIAQLYQKWS